MKYIYIPTTTLNFNNILSTGSISPAVVYAARRFGYNKFEVVPPNPFQHVLLLYDRYPIYSIEDTDRDNHPLVIRVRVERIPDGLRFARDIQVCDNTIYLDPASTEFLFDTLEAKKIALIKAEPSLTTKLIGLYQTRMQIINNAQHDSFKWSKEMLDGINDGTEAVLKNCEFDERINRLKGFACGYILGAYKSIDEKGAKYRSVLKEQRNEISAMLNDPSRINPDFLRKALESCSILDQLWSEERVGSRRFDPEQGDKIVIKDGLVDVLEDRRKYDPQSTLRLKRLFNMYCITSDFTGQLDEARFNVAFEGGKAIKTLMGSEWENSSNQTYINDLLNNVKSGSPFEFNSSSSLALKSFAAFVQKGDDLDKLESFLVDQGICDFRYAFALWGAMFGFSKIPKTIFNLPDKRGEYSYSRKMHDYVHNAVHSFPLLPPEEKVSQSFDYVDTRTPGEELPLELINKFKHTHPGAEHWIPSINKLWSECGNICKVFIAKLNKAKATDLGGKRKGIRKEDVISFFKEYLESESAPSWQPTILIDAQQPFKFWDDQQAWVIIRNAVPTNFQDEIKENLEWFQKEWKEPNSRFYGWQNKECRSHIKDKPLENRTNADAIDYYTRLLKNNRDRRLRDNKDFPTEAVIEKIRNLLSCKYR